jgi:hypothetical protein
MPETLEKLRPDRDLQCYFFRPSSIAALSFASPTGFTVSGSWRQQFDWVVIEWNRDNVFEHPLYRYLPDGDLSGLTLSYRETRTNCIPMDSALYPTVDWPYLRIWAPDASGVEQVWRVTLRDYATPTAGAFVKASATFTLTGSLVPGEYIELSWLDEHYYHVISGSDTAQTVLDDLALNINTFSTTVTAAVQNGNQIVLTNNKEGVEGNILGVLATAQFSPTSQLMTGGASPTEWQVTINFGQLPFSTTNIRKMRWTYSAALQPAAYQRSEFSVVISNWTVTGSNRAYQVAGPYSRRFEDDDTHIVYTGVWTEQRGNYSAGTIRRTTQAGAKCRLTYQAQTSHRLYLGSRRLAGGGSISVQVDSLSPQAFNLGIPDEDFLLRLPLGQLGPGAHTVEVTVTTPDFWFDLFELAVPESTVTEQPVHATQTLATDWDTDHSLALAPERVAWMMKSLGFTGRANHYVGALLFYELVNPGNVYATATVTFEGQAVFGQVVQIAISGTVYSRVTLLTDTLASVAKAFEYLINNGSTGVWAQASGTVLTLQARALGAAGNNLTLAATPSTGDMRAVASGPTFTGGVDGQWLTDLTVVPRLNRAARDWHQAYFAALLARGIEAAAAFSLELKDGDPSLAAGIAQRYPDGQPVLLTTPALQTNFSPTSLSYWKQAYLDMAQIMAAAGMTPFLQFGEVQWWYFPGPTADQSSWTHGGMSFYDEYTKAAFQTQYGRPIHVFVNNSESPAPWPEESAFLPNLVGEFTLAITNFVKATFSQAKFEVLYPPDVNDFLLTRVVNLPGQWDPTNLDVFKTENFTYTGSRDLNKSRESILLPLGRGFPRNRMAHLVGVHNSSEPWDWERRLAMGELCESVVLFALDQFTMIGYRLPLTRGDRRSAFLG